MASVLRRWGGIESFPPGPGALECISVELSENTCFIRAICDGFAARKERRPLEVELQLLKSQESTKELSFFIAREEVNALRLKIEELETERSQLEEEKRSLEMKLEQVSRGQIPEGWKRWIQLDKHVCGLEDGVHHSPPPRLWFYGTSYNEL
ncbi:UNVERIFIED_CONTAM: hypothetical protein K2H54_022807 [Gekko kuhli]